MVVQLAKHAHPSGPELTPGVIHRRRDLLTSLQVPLQGCPFGHRCIKAAAVTAAAAVVAAAAHRSALMYNTVIGFNGDVQV